MFEASNHYNLPDAQQEWKNELVLARSYINPKLVEFTPYDMSAMELLPQEPRYFT